MKISSITLLFVLLLSFNTSSADAPKTSITVGIPTILSGDWAGLGQNIVDTVKTYEKHYLRHPIEFVYEDAKISGPDGLRAYQKLITIDHVDMLIGATSSNGTMAASALIDNTKTLTITPVTGGASIDNAGEWIFRLGNSDVLNGEQQAEIFIRDSIKRVALVTEETE